MKKLLFLVILSSLFITQCTKSVEERGEEKLVEYALVIHGGAGTITRDNMTAEKEDAYKTKLTEALNRGYDILRNGGTSTDCVVEVIKVMENSPLFNAGKGAVFTSNGINELDASIMEGKTLNAGSVARLTRIKNPITLARFVMDSSKHVMMVGDGAEQYAQASGFELVDPSYFYTERRMRSLQRIQKRDTGEDIELQYPDDTKFGTVGCVALDKEGNLAAGTSTGGITNKKFGRVGDSPIIGAGTYANNNTCAISATGDGEFFIRNMVAYDISAMMEYKGFSITEAANISIHQKVEAMKAKGGVIGIDKNGNITLTFNTPGMYRGYITNEGKPTVLIYKN